MYGKAPRPNALALSPSARLQTLVENRSIYNLKRCELNVFETYSYSEAVPLAFPDLVLTSMLRGKKVMRLDEGQAFEYLPGQSVLVPAHSLMSIDFPEAEEQNPTQCLALAFDALSLRNILDRLNEHYPRQEGQLWQVDLRNVHLYNSPELCTSINKIVALCTSNSAAKDILLDLQLQELLIHLCQAQNIQKRAEEKSPLLLALIAYIRKHLSSAIDIDALAKEVALSRSSLYRFFKRELGLSPQQLIVAERLKKAKELLQNKELKIQEVAFASGFEDGNYFARLFKQLEGISPSEYRSCSLGA